MKIQKSILIALILSVGFGKSLSAQRIAAGGWHSVVICNDNSAKAFGENATGELGNGNNTDQNSPVSVGGLTNVSAVSAGGDQLEAHSLALKTDGTVWAWGSNLYGGLGNATNVNTNTPVQTLLLSNVIGVSAGGWHSSALKNDGTVWTWGWNVDGQLGDGTLTDRTIAGQVTGLSDVVQISSGTYHILALKSDGTVWAWGDNVSGQIGDGSTTDRKTPVQVSGLTDVVKISAGRFFSLAVKSDGTVWTWGENLYGQLGNGTTTDSSVPVQVSGLTGVTSIVATGAFHCMAVKNDNTVWSWGRNTYGSLGDNTVAHKSSPVQMIGISDVEGMAAGTNFSILYKTDGTFWGCGRNLSGQLGDGTVLQRNLLTQSTGVCPITEDAGMDEQTSSSIEVKAYPNPSATGLFAVQISTLTAAISVMEIEIVDLMGNVLERHTMDACINQQNLSIDLSNKANGIYFLTISMNEYNYSQKLKLIKQ